MSESKNGMENQENVENKEKINQGQENETQVETVKTFSEEEVNTKLTTAVESTAAGLRNNYSRKLDRLNKKIEELENKQQPPSSQMAYDSAVGWYDPKMTIEQFIASASQNPAMQAQAGIGINPPAQQYPYYPQPRVNPTVNQTNQSQTTIKQNSELKADERDEKVRTQFAILEATDPELRNKVAQIGNLFTEEMCRSAASMIGVNNGIKILINTALKEPQKIAMIKGLKTQDQAYKIWELINEAKKGTKERLVSKAEHQPDPVGNKGTTSEGVADMGLDGLKKMFKKQNWGA